MSVPVARVKVLVYLMSGLLAGLAGALNAARLSSGVTILGVGMELDVIAAVVIGGTLLDDQTRQLQPDAWGQGRVSVGHEGLQVDEAVN